MPGAPGKAGGDQDGVRRNLRAIVERHQLKGAFGAQLQYLLRGEDFATEPARLGQGAAGDVATAEAGGEAQVVFDARAQRGLATRSFAIHQQGAQPF